MSALAEQFFAISVWADDSKATPVTGSASGSAPFTTAPITRIAQGGIYRHAPLMDADDYKLSVFLEDKIAGALTKGNYFEVYAGHAGHQQLWLAGYVSRLMKTSAVQSSYDIAGVSALSFLSSYRNGDALFASWGLGYHNVLQRCNGINQVGQGAGTNQKGILPPTWQAVYVDGTFVPAATTTVLSAVAVNSTIIPVSNSNSINITNRAVQIQHGANFDWYGLDPTNPNPDSQHIQIVAPGTIRPYTAGDNVKMASYKLPGTGDDWFTANDTSLNSLKRDCATYNLYLRMRPGSTSRSGIVEIGPLLDSSGLQIWGGTQLAAQLGQADTAHSYHANLADAQAQGLAVIEDASLDDDFTKIVNCCWPFGKGKGDHARLIKSLVGSDPPGNGWATYQPAVPGRLYYIKTASATTWDGATYEYICFQRQDGLYQYGVINRGGNLGANQAPPYGFHETTIKNRTWTTPTLVLAAGLGAIQYNADPTPTYTFKVRHPLASASGVPTVPTPGQSIDIRFTGEVHDAADISSTPGATYGQQVSIGSYRYIKFPTIADPTDENGAVSTTKVQKMQRCVSVEDTWSNDGTYAATYTMGAGHFQRKDISEILAQDMISGHHEPDPYHTFTARRFDQVPLWMPNTPPLVYERPDTHTLVLQAGGFTVSDVPHSYFFDDGHSVVYTFQLTDTAQCLDFWFGKTPDGTLTTVASSAIYALFRLAGPTSGKRSGFYYTTDGTTLTKRGNLHAHEILDSAGRVLAWTSGMRVHMAWHNKKYTASVTAPDLTNVQTPRQIATWNDNKIELAQWGAIGFHLVGGAADGLLLKLDAHAVYSHPVQKATVGTRGMHPAVPHKKHRRKTNPGGTGHFLVVTS